MKPGTLVVCIRCVVTAARSDYRTKTKWQLIRLGILEHADKYTIYLPIAMMYNNSGQIIDVVVIVYIWVPGIGRIVQHILWHIQRFNREIDAQIDFCTEKIIPTETFDVQAQHIWQATDPKPFGRLLFAFTRTAIVQLGFGQLFNLSKRKIHSHQA